MIAVVLAAGVGDRLGDFTREHPKCLLPLGERHLLGRSFEALARCGVDEVVITVGHCADQILSAVEDYAPLPVRLVENRDYREGSILSLWYARHHLGGDDVLLMDADVLYPQTLLDRLVGSRNASCTLLDGRVEGTGEEMILCAAEGRVWDIVRRRAGEVLIPPPGVARYDRVGESVGFLKLSAAHGAVLREILERRVGDGERSEEYEASFPELFGHCEVGYERVDDLPWTEIDFPADVKRAVETILPAIEGLRSGAT